MQIKIQDAQGVPLTRIAANLGIDRKTARKLRDADVEPAVTVRRRKSKLVEYADWMRDRLAARGSGGAVGARPQTPRSQRAVLNGSRFCAGAAPGQGSGAG